MDKQLVIAGNMLALARKRKGGSKRSMMLRTIMPFLSQGVGDELADAINSQDSAKFTNAWNKVRGEIVNKINSKHGRHSAHANVITGEDLDVLTKTQSDGGWAPEINEERPYKSLEERSERPKSFTDLYAAFHREFQQMIAQREQPENQPVPATASVRYRDE